VEYDNVTLGVVGQWHHLLEREERKTLRLLANPDTNPGYPSITHGGDVLFWGVELSVALEAER
jgi:hypothetical protein